MIKRFDNQTNPVNAPLISVLIAFYNKFDFLTKVLASLSIQELKNFEIIICDDGSRDDVIAQLHAFMKQSPLRIVHLWHPDDGFRKNRMLNHGIQNASADYLVFVDGDCVLHPKFLSDHYEQRNTKTVLAGRRVELTPWVSKLTTADRIVHGFLQKQYWWIFFAILWMKDSSASKGIRLTSATGRRFADRKPRGIVGSNFSLHKQDLLEINGFDWRYQGPGIGEDTDIEYRLRLNHCAIKPLTHMGIQYHLYHRLLKRDSKNDQLFAQVQAQRAWRTKTGIYELEHADNR